MKCLLCNTEVETINFGCTPIAGYVVDTLKESQEQIQVPLDMTFCPKCNLARYNLPESVDELLSVLYKNQQATYSLTPANLNSINRLVDKFASNMGFGRSSTVLEIGCNDGSMLKSFRDRIGCKVVGVEPSNTFTDVWLNNDLRVVNSFFGSSILEQLKENTYDIIIVRHVLEHVMDIHDFTRCLAEIMTPETTLVVEVPYLRTILSDKRIDNISFPHINCFSLRSLTELFKGYQLGIVHYELVDTDGGAILTYIRKNESSSNEQMDHTKFDELISLKSYINQLSFDLVKKFEKYQNGELIGYGAGAKGQHLIHILELQRFISIVVDDMPSYQNKYIPRTNIKVESPDKWLHHSGVKAVINLATTHRNAVLNKVPEGLHFVDIIEQK